MGAECENIQTSSYKINKAWEVTYTVVTVASNTALAYFKVVKSVDPKILITRKKNCDCVVMDVNETYCGGYFTIYRNIKSLFCIPETNVIFQLYLSIKKD